jgi:hypothetical protein
MLFTWGRAGRRPSSGNCQEQAVNNSYGWPMSGSISLFVAMLVQKPKHVSTPD